MLTLKNLFCLLLIWTIFFSPISISGQSAPDTMSLEEKLLNVFSELDSSEITTGILYERVPEYVQLDIYDGRDIPDSMAISRFDFEMAYGMINWASYNNSALCPIDTVFDTFRRWSKSRFAILSAMYFRYNRFKENAIYDSLIIADTVDNKFYRGPNTSTSPYREDTLFAFSCIKNESHTLHQEFVLDSTVLFSNIPLGFTNIEIDFDDGSGFKSVNPGQRVSINYPEYGKYYIRLKMTTENGKELLAKTFIDIKPETSQLPSPPQNPYGEAEVVKLIPEPDCETVVTYDPYDGYPNGEMVVCNPYDIMIYQFKNNLCGKTEIRKPLILIEGFDPNNHYDDGFVEELLKSGNPSLGEKLYPEEYDIFYLNFGNSTIDIFEQAVYVRQAIEWINEQKHQSEYYEDNVVVGFSMGGLVGRIALKNMENDGENHETRFYMTFDSPMKGANIPLSMQFLIKHISEYKIFGTEIRHRSDPELADIKKARKAIDSPAAKQMLYYHYSTWNSSNGFNPLLWWDTRSYAEDCELHHDIFYNQFEELEDLDIPEIAISNGTIVEGDINVIGQTFFPNDILLRGDIDLGIQDCWLMDDCVTFQADLVLRALPDGAGEIYDGTIVINVLVMGIESHMYRYIYNSLPYDSAPGGSRPFEDAEHGSTGLTVSWERDAHCFVPTISSLSLDDINQNMNPYYSEDLTNPDNVLPFVNFIDYTGSVDEEYQYGNSISPNYNQPHITFRPKTTEFFLSYILSKNLLESSSGLTILNNKTYNFGKVTVESNTLPYILDNIIDFDLDVYDNGKLWYNRNDLLAFTDDSSNPPNDSPQSYRGIIKGAECGEVPILVDIFNGGEMIVGDQSINNTATVEIRDNGTLEVGENGLVKLEDQSEIVVKEDGTLNVEFGGILNSTWGSTIRIESGGKLHVKPGGILRIQHYSDLIVEDGGQLIIDAGAKIQLWDGQDPDGAANIHIKGGGELVWRGKPDFSGNGYFQFDKDNILTLQGDFELEGMGQDYKLIQLNSHTSLFVKDYDLKLSDCKVQYTEYANIHSQNNKVNINYVDFYCETELTNWGIWCDNPTDVTIDNSNFYDFINALKIEGESNNDYFFDYINSDHFYRNDNAVNLINRRNCTISDCYFNSDHTSINTMNTKKLILTDCNMDDVNTGVRLHNTNDFQMKGGTLNFLLTGIDATIGYNNISLSEGASIKNPNSTPPLTSDPTDVFAAVALNGTVTGQYPDYTLQGYLHMDCATLNAYTGVKGSNIIFEIDAIENSDGDQPNSFICHYAFNVCYYQELSSGVGTIKARGNYWEYEPYEANPNPPFNATNIYSFKNIPWGDDCGHPVSNDHPLDFSDAVTDPPTNCSRGGDREENDYYNFASNTDTQLTENTNIINNKNDIIIYPNPVSDVFTIIIDDDNQYDMTLFNIFGQIVLNKSVFNGTKIHTEKLKSGIYFYKIEGNNKKEFNGKLVINK